ncbi:MAG TPA: TIGR01777 family oxidoreductase [Thermodesulfobacteriota bacterium]|nr:TIGR01777 family oxidoreductase [Thermodesulfobacteriota bacterium]
MRVLVSGSTGFIGSALVPVLEARGDTVVRLVRRPPRPGEAAVAWDPQAGRLDPAGLEGFDAVVHLAGENVAAGRWTAERKRRIRDSRVEGTRLLCEGLARLTRPPQVLVAASAIGYYGDRGAEWLTEESPPGTGFLAEVARAWEGATEPAADRGIRVVRLRIGVVLSPAGGALARMLPLFRRGLGGRIGSGRQYLSWIALPDLTGAVAHVLGPAGPAGPVNAVAPNPVTNAEFAETLGRVLGRPARLPAPAALLRLALGEMADEMLLASARVQPARLLATGYRFRYPELEPALRALLAGT